MSLSPASRSSEGRHQRHKTLRASPLRQKRVNRLTVPSLEQRSGNDARVAAIGVMHARAADGAGNSFGVRTVVATHFPFGEDQLRATSRVARAVTRGLG